MVPSVCVHVCTCVHKCACAHTCVHWDLLGEESLMGSGFACPSGERQMM